MVCFGNKWFGIYCFVCIEVWKVILYGYIEVWLEICIVFEIMFLICDLNWFIVILLFCFVIVVVKYSLKYRIKYFICYNFVIFWV